MSTWTEASLGEPRAGVGADPPEEAGRLEYKTFEATCRLDDFSAYFLLWLELLLDEGLRGRASDQTRTYDLGAVARYGLAAAASYILVAIGMIITSIYFFVLMKRRPRLLIAEQSIGGGSRSEWESTADSVLP